MRVGVNPEKENNTIKFDIYHRIIIPVYIPNFEGYFKDGLEIFKLCIQSLLMTVHEKTRITIYNNASHIVVENYISGFEEEDNIPEKVELVTGTKYMPTPKFIDSWSYSWMINNFHNFGWSQVVTRFLRMYKDYSYEMMYDMLLESISNDDGPVGKSFREAIGDSAFNYMLGVKTKINSEEEFIKRLKNILSRTEINNKSFTV